MTQSGELRPSLEGIGSCDDDHDVDSHGECFARDISTVNDEIEAACAVNTTLRHTDIVQTENSGYYVSGFVGNRQVSSRVRHPCEKFTDYHLIATGIPRKHWFRP